MVTPVQSAGDIFSGGLNGLLNYWWVIAVLVVLGIGGVIAWWTTKYRQKNGQWTHKLYVEIELPNGELDPNKQVFNMRRWKHKDEQTAPLFELEKPLIGSRIFVELEKYTNTTSYTVILGNDGRLYIPTKTIMNRDKQAREVSVKHAGIDRARQQYNNRFEQMNATPTKIDAVTLMKLGLLGAGIIVILILGITGLKAWGERASYDAAEEEARLRSSEMLVDSMEISESVMNTIVLLLPDLKEMYGNNIQAKINEGKDKLNSTG